jgi:hypothetical protein
MRHIFNEGNKAEPIGQVAPFSELVCAGSPKTLLCPHGRGTGEE